MEIRRFEKACLFQHSNLPEIIKEDWGDSYIFNLFYSTKFMFIIYRFDKDNNLYLSHVKFWNMPVDDIEEVHKVWTETVKVIKEGVVIKHKNGRDFNNLPGQSFNKVSHVRPHGQNKADTYDLPDGRKFTKQCFWLNNKYILNQVL